MIEKYRSHKGLLVNELRSKKLINIFITSNYIKHVSISAFVSLVGILGGSASSAIGLKICAVTTGIQKHQSIIKTKEEKPIG